ncbi:MAG: hypothetical protein HY712_02960 [candidate division NC10 bacterium]|nr:hypothetical protein [candidate division NC10 bacterium]
MAAGGRREAVDGKIRDWEQGLERLRVWLANAPDAVHRERNPQFVELYRRKEVVKSRWEAVRGVYRPTPEAIRRVEEALADMEAAWREAQSILAESSARRS